MKRWMWMQSIHSVGHPLFIWKDENTVNDFIANCQGKFTDLLMTWYHGDDHLSLLPSAATRPTDHRVAGLLPGEFTIRAAHAAGMKVHLWIPVGFFTTYSQMYDPPPFAWSTAALADPACNVQNWCNFSLPEMRKKIAEFVVGFVEANDLDGIHLDYLRIHWEMRECPVITPDEITQVLLDTRTAIPDLELTVAISGRPDNNIGDRRDVERWLSERLVDQAFMMSYVSRAVEEKSAYIATLPNPELIVPGVAIYDGATVFENYWNQWIAAGYSDLAVFDSHWTIELGLWEIIPTKGDYDMITNDLQLRITELKAQRDALLTIITGLEDIMGQLGPLDAAADLAAIEAQEAVVAAQEAAAATRQLAEDL